MIKFTGHIKQYPARATAAAYLALIAVGATLLTLPVCRAEGATPLSWLDALFTSTSAACVTGLVVRSTGGDLSIWGQLLVLALIQVGGIGIMTLTTLATFTLGRAADLHHRALLAGAVGEHSSSELKWVVKNVIKMTLQIEAIGFVLLAARLVFDLPLGDALWSAAFHSISAFCNAGFSLHDDSLTRYQGDAIVNLVVMSLIVSGGIGFPVMLDLKRHWHRPWPDLWIRLTLHSKFMLVGTAALLSIGFLAMFALEFDGALAELPLHRKIFASLFFSVTARTAGFNTLDMAELTNATLFFTVILMAIGAGPCSTAGGFKVSTLMVLVLRAWSTFRGRVNINIARRTLPREVVDRATATAMLFAALGLAALTSLLVLEQSTLPHAGSQGIFLDALFEVTSALGTVGLSTGLTDRLTEGGQAIIILLMFAGRLGPISVAVALSRRERRVPIEFPQEEPLIG